MKFFKSAIASAAVLICCWNPQPASARGFQYGALGGKTYCNARGIGIDHDTALQLAVDTAQGPNVISGSYLEQKNVEDAVDYIQTFCNFLWPG